ncbi:MAG: RnfH family protein [Acidiferrobacterales bacterium]|nr:RnfH family protein [Acidiferrobacterales bacterium]
MHSISVSIVYAKQDEQVVIEKQVPRGTSAMELVELSQIRNQCVELASLESTELELGIYSQRIEHDHLLEEGDRVEIYRELTADPKEVRRQLAALGKTMGKK